MVKTLAVSTDDIEVRFAYNREVQKRLYEGTDTPETLSTTFVYDDFGNVTEERNYGYDFLLIARGVMDITPGKSYGNRVMSASFRCALDICFTE